VKRLVSSAFALLLLLIALLAFAAPYGPTKGLEESALLAIRVVDTETGRLAPCTVAIIDSSGRKVTGPPSFPAGIRSGGELVRELPPGRTLIRVSRGFETTAVDKEVYLLPGEKAEVILELSRAVDLRSRGWYSGDSHAHMLHGERQVPVTFDDVALAAQAEDLQYLALSHDWDLENPTPEALERELGSRSIPSCVLTWNLEAPKNYYKGDAGRCLGHCWNLGMAGRAADGSDVIRLLLASSAFDYESDKPSYANFESHALIREQGGAVFYTHPLRWWTGSWGGRGGYRFQESMRISNMAVELPLDVLLGPTFDGLDVMTTSHEVGADEKSFQLWSLLLNQGYRLAATASSDACFDRPGGATPGAARTYTFLPDGFSIEAVARATAAGRTFATTGPLLLLSVNGQPPGLELPADGISRTMRVEAWASGEDKGNLTSLELWRNGVLFEKIPLQARHASRDFQVRDESDAWYCARLYGSDPERQRAISGAFFFVKNGAERPNPVPIKVRIRVVDKADGRLLSGTAEEVFYQGTKPVTGKTHAIEAGGKTLQIPGTARIRVAVSGYRPLTLSPFLDNPKLLALITALQAEDLLDWETFERIRELLGRVELLFALEPEPSG
jgi:hypothetical protein